MIDIHKPIDGQMPYMRPALVDKGEGEAYVHNVRRKQYVELISLRVEHTNGSGASKTCS